QARQLRRRFFIFSFSPALVRLQVRCYRFLYLVRYSLYQAHGPVKVTRLRQPRQESKEDWPSSRSARLHSAPKGLLRHYILHRIAQMPVHGYEVIQDIESRTEGAW